MVRGRHGQKRQVLSYPLLASGSGRTNGLRRQRPASNRWTTTRSSTSSLRSSKALKAADTRRVKPKTGARIGDISDYLTTCVLSYSPPFVRSKALAVAATTGERRGVLLKYHLLWCKLFTRSCVNYRLLISTRVGKLLRSQHFSSRPVNCPCSGPPKHSRLSMLQYVLG